MSVIRCPALFVLLCLAPTRAGAGEPVATDAYLARVRDGARQLDRDIEQLQDALVGEPAGPKERALYRRVDALRDRLDAFQAALKAGTRRAELYQRFDEVDSEGEAIFRDVHDLFGERGPAARAARYVRASGDQLDYLLADGDEGATRTNRAVTRQARALAAAAADLHRAAEYALDDSPGRGPLLADLLGLRTAAQEFATGVGGKSPPKDPKAAFGAVNDAWRKIVQRVKQLPAREAASFGRAASRMDQVHDRLFRLLGIEGERPRLTVRT